MLNPWAALHYRRCTQKRQTSSCRQICHIKSFSYPTPPLKPESRHPALNIALRRGCIFFIAVKNIIGYRSIGRSFRDNIHTVGQSTCSMRAKEIYLFAGQVILLQKGEQRHGYAVPPVRIVNCSPPLFSLENTGLNAIQKCVLCSASCLYSKRNEGFS